MVARRRDRQLCARQQAPHVGRPAPAFWKALHCNAVEPVRAKYDGRVVTYIGPPINLHPDVEMAARCRRNEVARGLDLKQANVGRQVAHLRGAGPCATRWLQA